MDLCASASHFDWLYGGVAAGAVVASVYVDINILKGSELPGRRLTGAGFVGLSWGIFLSGGYLSLPSCDPTWTGGSPPEGNVRSPWPMGVVIALLSGVTAPALEFIALGPLKPEWSDSERAGRLFIGMGAGVVGSLLPYLISPLPWRASREIERIRLRTSEAGVGIGYELAF